MVNRNAKNGYKIVKKDHINVACELSLSNKSNSKNAVFMRFVRLFYNDLITK